MSIIKIDINGKGGPACSYSIDFEIGCRNQCIGCYGSKTSMMGQNFFHGIKEKEYNEKKFRNSCKLEYSKGCRIVRLGKHSDPGFSGNIEILKSVLGIAGEEGLRLVLVSKSLGFSSPVSHLARKYNHKVHISLGMITSGPSDLERFNVYRAYRKNVKYQDDMIDISLRVVTDVTKQLPTFYDIPDRDNIIVTPMRFASKDIAKQYGADLSKYKFVNGYYRPQEVHESWSVFKNWCGEVGEELKCCKCLIGDK
jgi:hypothetical protein